MSLRARLLLFAAISVVCVGIAVAATARGVKDESATVAGADPADAAALLAEAGPGRPILVMRDLEGRRPGRLVVTEPGAPAATRRASGLICDRVHYAAGNGVCVRRGNGLLNQSSVDLLDGRLRVRGTVDVAGTPSRARVSPDGRLASVTTFVSGHSYGTAGAFSTLTTLIDLESMRAIGDLEAFATFDGDRRVTAPDRNFWGVTFAADGRTFYATMATGGQTHLIRGDVPTRRAVVIADNAECPSLSPDGTRVGYKKLVDTGAGSPKVWHFTVLDLATLRETPIAEPAPRDDQLEWLDDDRVLYANGEEIWTVPADGTGTPERFAAAAGSPAVVR